MKNEIQIRYFQTPAGELVLGSFQDQLCLADWRYRKMRKSIDQRIQKALDAEYREGDTPVLQNTVDQIHQYFDQKRKEFDIPLLLLGSDFQKEVWNALLEIPYGQTETYLGLSRKLGNEKAIRAVASANGANAISLIVPCHRIIGSNGDLVGYAGGKRSKQQLLELEGALQQDQLSLFS